MAAQRPAWADGGDTREGREGQALHTMAPSAGCMQAPGAWRPPPLRFCNRAHRAYTAVAARPTCHPGQQLKLLGEEAQLRHDILSDIVPPAAAVVAACGHRQAPHAACCHCLPAAGPAALLQLAPALAGAAAQGEVGGGAAQVLAEGHPRRGAALQARNLCVGGGRGRWLLGRRREACLLQAGSRGRQAGGQKQAAVALAQTNCVRPRRFIFSPAPRQSRRCRTAGAASPGAACSCGKRGRRVQRKHGRTAGSTDSFVS